MATWQEERGERYGNARKARAKAKVGNQKSQQKKEQIN